jgi:hypothetical protein
MPGTFIFCTPCPFDLAFVRPAACRSVIPRLRRRQASRVVEGSKGGKRRPIETRIPTYENFGPERATQPCDQHDAGRDPGLCAVDLHNRRPLDPLQRPPPALCHRRPRPVRPPQIFRRRNKPDPPSNGLPRRPRHRTHPERGIGLIVGRHIWSRRSGGGRTRYTKGTSDITSPGPH